MQEIFFSNATNYNSKCRLHLTITSTNLQSHDFARTGTSTRAVREPPFFPWN